jgi:hypothetical protein
MSEEHQLAIPVNATKHCFELFELLPRIQHRRLE